MSQPVKLSDALVLDARIAGEAQERSIAGQVEFWAKLGRSVELMLEGQQVLTLCRTVGATPLADLVDLVDTPAGREMLKTYLDSEPYPHFEAHPSQAGLLVRIEESGERTVGRFVNRAFISWPLEDGSAARSISSDENTVIDAEYTDILDADEGFIFPLEFPIIEGSSGSVLGADARSISFPEDEEDSRTSRKSGRRSRSARA